MTSPSGRSFSVPGDSVAESDLEIVDDDPYDIGRSPSPFTEAQLDVPETAEEDLWVPDSTMRVPSETCSGIEGDT